MYDYQKSICIIIAIVFEAITMSIQVQIAWLLSCHQMSPWRCCGRLFLFVWVSQLYLCIYHIRICKIKMALQSSSDIYYVYDYCNCSCAMIKIVFEKFLILKLILCCNNCATIITAKGLRACRCGMSENLTFTMRMTVVIVVVQWSKLYLNNS